MAAPITPWRTTLHPVVNGEDVAAVPTNRLPSELVDRTQHLKEIIDAIEAGEALYIADAPLAPEVLSGQPVYWNAAEQEYDQAIADVEVDSNGRFTIKASAYVFGMCVYKSTATRGTIQICGNLENFDFTNAIGTSGATTAEAGAYYLSASTPGLLTKQQPNVSIFVAYLRGNSSAQIYPVPRNIVEDHTHYVFDLTAAPAGVLDDCEPDEKYTFVSVDPNSPGWLPASDPSFGGLAPAGAVFGYNLAMHAELQRVFPPLPLDSAYLEADGIAVPTSVYSIDANGLWWYNDCYAKGPWPLQSAPGSSSSPSSSSSSSSATPACDSGTDLEKVGYVRRDPAFKPMRLWFTKMTSKTAAAVVTSLRPATGSPIRVYGCDGVTPATVGDLQLALDFTTTIQEDRPGYLAFKGITGTVFQRGPIVEGLIAGTNVQLIPVPTLGDTTGGITRGRMTINVLDPSGGVREGAINTISLDEARQGSINDVFYLYFPSGMDSSMRGRIDVSGVSIPSPAVMTLTFTLLTRAAGTLPNLSLTYRRITQPTVPCTPVDLPLADTALADLTPSTCGVLATNKIITVTSAAFAVTAGDVIFYTLGRLGATDGYAGDVAVLRQSYTIVGT